jgi:hypothetical protein
MERRKLIQLFLSVVPIASITPFMAKAQEKLRLLIKGYTEVNTPSVFSLFLPNKSISNHKKLNLFILLAFLSFVGFSQSTKTLIEATNQFLNTWRMKKGNWRSRRLKLPLNLVAVIRYHQI